jgi:hypothetical protein
MNTTTTITIIIIITTTTTSITTNNNISTYFTYIHTSKRLFKMYVFNHKSFKKSYFKFNFRSYYFTLWSASPNLSRFSPVQRSGIKKELSST